MYLLAEVPLVGILLCELLPTAKEMVPVASRLRERREKILLELETLGEKEVLLLFGALLVLWYSWHPFSSAGWTGGIDTCASGPCRCAGVLVQQ